ncbi:MAG: hypothetical protein ACUVTN_12230 [Thermodesulfobacteriota bacterium]
MIAYEIYWVDDKGEEHLLGILPEKRKDQKRITKQSIMKWAELIMGSHLDSKKIYFIQVEVDQ